MKASFTHKELGDFAEVRHNFATYLEGQAAWLGKPTKLIAMGTAEPNFWVRDCSMAVLESLFDNQEHWAKETRKLVLRKLSTLDAGALEFSGRSADEFWSSLRLESISTDDDLNIEFKFGSDGFIPNKELWVCGFADVGLNEIFLTDESAGS